MHHNHNFWRGTLVRLRAMEPSDIDRVLNSPDESDSELERCEDFIHFPMSRMYERQVLENLARSERNDDTFFWIIENSEGQHVGYINTFDCDRRVGCFKYALAIFRPFWQRGYARDAITLVLRYYFRELRYQKATVLVYSFNERSVSLHQSLRFVFEGRLRRMVYTNGRHYDELYFGMTCEEFDLQDASLNLMEVDQSVLVKK